MLILLPFTKIYVHFFYLSDCMSFSAAVDLYFLGQSKLFTLPSNNAALIFFMISSLNVIT